jgi:retinol-binding protein 3
MYLLAFVMVVLAAAPVARAQPADVEVTPALRKQLIDGVSAALRAAYVFPATAKQMEAALRKQSYAKVTSAAALAEAITADLQAAGKDLHVKVRYSREPFPDRKPGVKPTPAEAALREQRAAKWNYGFVKLERLAGNIGYLELEEFESPALAGPAAAAAFAFLAGTDALIIDLRRNGGGEPAMVALMVSYLLPAGDEVLINSIYERPTDRTQQYWAIPHLPAPRYAKPVYVLTSQRTFSGAEEFAYDLQALKRATVIGEQTRGGANPGDFVRVHPNFAVFVPSGRAINPITKTNWEGVGVKPDVVTPAADALAEAHRRALAKLPPALGPGLREEIDRAAAKLRKP